MANSKFTMTFEIREDGSLVKVQQGIGKAGKAVKDLTAAQEAGTKSADRYSRAQNGGVASANNAARGMSKLIETAGGNNSGLVAAYATLATNAFAVSAAFNALRNAAQVEQMMKGLEVQGAHTGRSLKNVSNSLQELTGYSVSAADAMSTVALMSSAGFSTEGMEKLTTVATNAAYALGRNVPDALDRITKGVTKLEPELLDELGIMTKLSEAQSKYALENNKSAASLTSFEKRQAMLNAVIAEGEAKFGGLSDQVSANPYDKLAASFSNLMKTVLSVANTVLGPIANIFSNQGLLLGGVLLFVSTIRKQLLPAMYLMGKVAQERRQHFVEMAKDSRDAAKASSELANAEQKRAIAQKTSAFTNMKAKAPTPKSFDFDAAAINALDKNTKAYEKNISALDKSINSRAKNIEDQENKLAGLRKTWSDTHLTEKKKELAAIEQTKKALQDLYNVQEQGEASTSKAKLKAAAENTRYFANIQGARAADAKSQAIELAGEGKVAEAMQRRAAATTNYRRQALLDARANNIAAGKGKEIGTFQKASIGLRTSLFNIGTGAQIAGAAFMKFIPYIGIAATALSGAWAIYEKFFRSDSIKAQIEALKKFKEVLDNTRKSIDELNRLQEANISIGQKAAQTLIIQSNATAEIAGALDAVKKATAKAATENTVDSLWEVMIGSPDDAVAYATGVAKNSKFFEPLAKELQNSTGSYLGTALGAGIGGALGTFLGPLGTVAGAALGGYIGNNIGIALAEMLPTEFNNIDELAVASLKSIDQLSRLINKDLYDSFVNAAGGAEILANSEVMREEVINQIARAYAGLSEGITDLQEGFKKAGTAVEEFFTGAVKKTPFDSLVTSFQDIDRAIYNINKTIAGSADLESQFALLTEMPESLMRTLTAGQQQVLLQARNINNQVGVYRTEIERLQGQQEEADSARKAELDTQIQQQTVLMNAEKAKLEPLQASTREIQGQLTTNRALFEQYQQQTRTIDNQLKLHSAIMASEQELYALSAEGEARRIDMHNQQIRLQQAQLNVQIAMIDMYLAQQKANQLILRQELAKLNASRELHKENAAAAAREFASIRDQQRLTVLREASENNQGEQARRRLDSLDRYVEGLKTATTQAERESDLAALTNTALADRMQFAGSYLSDSEKAYFYAAQSAAITQLQTQNLETQEGISQSIRDLEASRASLAAEVAAIGRSTISDAEKQARLNEVSTRLAEKVNTLTQENSNLSLESVDIQTKINNVVNDRTKLINQELLLNVRRNASEISTLRNERRRFEAENAAHMETIASMNAESTMQQAGLVNLAEEHRLTLANYDLRIQNLEKASELLIFETLLKDGVEGTLQAVKDSLDYYQRRLDLTKELKNQELEIRKNAATINILRRGTAVDERTQSQLAVEAAAEQRAQAHEQYALRVMSINAEYDLLDAQRKVQLENTKFQRYAIAAFWQIMNGGAPLPDQLQTAINNLDNSIGAMEGISTSSMRNLAIAGAANEVLLADQRYEIARLERDNSGRNRPAWFGAMANARERQASRTREEAAVERGNNPAAQIQQQYRISYESQKQALEPVVTALQNIQRNQTNATTTNPTTLAPVDAPQPQAQSSGRGTRQLTEMLNPNGYNINFSGPFATALTAALNDFFDATGRTSRIDLQSGVRSTRRQQEIWDAGVTDSMGVRRTRAGRPIARPGTSPHEATTAADLPSAIEAALTSGGFLQRHGLSNIAGDPGHVQLSSRTTASVLQAAASGSTPLSVVVEGQVDTSSSTTLTGQPSAQPASAPPITLPGTDAAGNLNKLTEGTRVLGQAAINTITPLQKLFDFVVTGVETAAGMMQDIVTQASERLGVDFGPQGRIFNSINSTMQMLPNVFTDIQGAIGGTFNKSWADFDAQRVTQNEALKRSVEAQGQVWDESMGDTTTKAQFHAQKISDAFMAASQMIGAVGSLLKASSDAKLAKIDKEIAAEQKRDGKSAESVAKLDALEKKKDSIARKSFNLQKKLMIAQAVMSTAAAVAGQLASPPVGPWNIALAVMMGALGMAQVAMIAGTQYESSYSPKAASMPTSLSVGKRSDTVDLAKGPNANAGGEVGYLRGAEGTGSNASNYRTVGSAYGGELMRGYGNRGFVVGEKGPEVITPETPISVTPANDVGGAQPINASFNIHAIDSQGVQDVLVAQKGNIIKMLREAANASGKSFMEDVNVNVYTRPSVGKL